MKKHIFYLLALCGVQSHAWSTQRPVASAEQAPVVAQPVQPVPAAESVEQAKPGAPTQLTAQERKEIIRTANKKDAVDAKEAYDRENALKNKVGATKENTQKKIINSNRKNYTSFQPSINYEY